MLTKYFLIVDYNLTRIDDVRTMRDHLRHRHGLATILIRPNPRPIDHEICDVVIDAYPRAADFVDRACGELAKFRTSIQGGIVFSDDAVQSGAALLERLGLPVDDALLAFAALSKLAYRSIEQSHDELFRAQGIRVPEYLHVENITELASFLKRHPEGIVVKPACEGNNRGVVVLHPGDDLRLALQTIDKYVSDGVICEEYITDHREFSFDGIGALWFLTEKISATGRYPVEMGQIVPAMLSPIETHTLRRAGNLANLLVGQREGPFHNEIRLSDDGTQATVIEPNRRPAGMRIWQLARAVYRINLFCLWIDHVLGHPLPAHLPTPKGRAATIMLGVPHDGLLRPISRSDVRAILEQTVTPSLRSSSLIPDDAQLTWIDSAPLGCEIDRIVRADPQDNGDFIALACLHIDRSDLDFRAIVAAVQATWKRAITPFLSSPRIEATASSQPSLPRKISA
ncbi:MAG TPA: hypothetical protein VGZ00_01825 [Candidatus Baltobacteraceae bacterium]|jgi:hypothetical protein|nr:hypothetical protein [Candidatus Baltobacteraceae bacterium]